MTSYCGWSNERSGKCNYHKVMKFCSKIFIGTKRRWRYIGGGGGKNFGCFKGQKHGGTPKKKKF